VKKVEKQLSTETCAELCIANNRERSVSGAIVIERSLVQHVRQVGGSAKDLEKRVHHSSTQKLSPFF
jgi:hypothetical protein